MIVREATEADAEPIAQAWIAAWRWAYSGILPPDFIEARSDLSRRAENVRADLGRGSILVAEEATVLGFASGRVPAGLAGYDAEIASLYVDPSAARRGVGHALARALARRFVEDGHRSLAIHTLRENRIGRGFYDKIGGRVVSEDEWVGQPCVWYGWDEAALARLAA